MPKRNPIVTFAVAYQGYHQAIQKGDDNGRIVYQDMLVTAADTLGIDNREMSGLADHRAEVKRRHDDAFASYCARHPAMGDQ
jgi:hypothetical protein